MLNLLILLLLLVGCSQQATEPLQFHGSTMGTTYTVKILSVPTTATIQQTETNIAAILQQLHASMSTYDATSEISRFNLSQSTEWFSVTDNICDIVEKSQKISQLSDGAFDITVAPAVNLWGFGAAPSRTTPPSNAEITDVKQKIGYQHIQTRCHHTGFSSAIRKDRADVTIDLSAIAQGYGADKVAEYLNSLKIKNYLVDVGGELRAQGVNVQGSAWRVGVEKPIPFVQGTVEEVIPIKNCAVATSGTYRNFFEFNGQRFSHTINPRTASPITHNLVSVTIITATAADADAWATAISVLGPESGYQIAVKNNLAALLIEQKDDKFLAKRTISLIKYFELQSFN
jgi:thiamine biosynthesis lipoprotein